MEIWSCEVVPPLSRRDPSKSKQIDATGPTDGSFTHPPRTYAASTNHSSHHPPTFPHPSGSHQPIQVTTIGSQLIEATTLRAVARPPFRLLAFHMPSSASTSPTMVMTQEDFARFRAKVIEIKGEGSEGALFLGAGLYDPRKFNAESINELTSDDFLWVRCKPVSPTSKRFSRASRC